MVPSAASEKGLQSPLGDRAGVLEKHRNVPASFDASIPPLITRSDRPRVSSLTAVESAAKELAQAASVMWLVPCRSNLLAIRPAITLPSRPGKVDSCHGS